MKSGSHHRLTLNQQVTTTHLAYNKTEKIE